MSNAVIHIDKRFAVKNSGILSGLDVQLEQSENDHPACKKMLQGCKT